MSRLRASRRDIILLAVGVVVVLVALGAIALLTVKRPQLSADGALTEYVSAIETGDLATADTLAPTPATLPQPVSGSALADPANRITAVTTSIGSTTGGRANGTVTYELDGHRHTAHVKLATGKAQLGLLPNWHVTTPLTTTIALTVPARGTAVVNGVDATFGSDLTVTVYPGKYAVGLAPNNAWYTSTMVTVDAGTAKATAPLTVTPTAALGAEALTQVKAAIDACIATAAPVPAGCPFSEPAVGTLAGFHWVLDEYPTIAFLDPTRIFLQGGQVTADFVLTHSYIVNKKEQDPIAINGSGVLTFSGSSVKVTITPH